MGSWEWYRAAQRTRVLSIIVLVFTVVVAVLVEPSYARPAMEPVDKAFSIGTDLVLGVAVLLAFVAAVTSPGIHPVRVRWLVVSALVLLNVAAVEAGRLGVAEAAAGVTILPTCLLIGALFVVSRVPKRRH